MAIASFLGGPVPINPAFFSPTNQAENTASRSNPPRRTRDRILSILRRHSVRPDPDGHLGNCPCYSGPLKTQEIPNGETMKPDILEYMLPDQAWAMENHLATAGGSPICSFYDVST